MFNRKHYERIVCKDGFSMSVQASKGHYCNPKNDQGPYCEVEVGAISNNEPLLSRHAEDPNNPTKTVYGWVPSLTVYKIIEKHGGAISGEVPPMVIG